jgi:hypothetical protein
MLLGREVQMIRFVIAVLAVTLFTSPGSAADWSGHWVVRSDATDLFEIHVEGTNTPLRAWWVRPEHFSFTSRQISDIVGPSTRFAAIAVKEDADRLLITFRRPGTTDDTQIAIMERPDGIFALTFPEIPFEPLAVLRQKDAPNLPNWPAGAVYPLPHDYPNNAELKAIFDADQAARNVESIGWSKLKPEDAARKKRVRELLDSGALQSGVDFFYAAFIYQHGNDPGDYLLAHTLSMAAMARGYDAGWISAATMDRYLQIIGKPQIFGTQYQCVGKQPSPGDYQSNLVTDDLRVAVGVPKLQEQESQREGVCH